jgi:carboxypeptidase PM20D1
MLCAHLDVVPVEPQDNWTVPPFDGVIRDGFIWGRGALDIKNIAFGMFEAVEYLLSKGFQPERTIVLAFGHDEEISGFSGAQEIARYLDEMNFRAEFILDEGLNIVKGVVPGVPGPVALIGTEEKGSQTIRLNIKAVGGHGSMPPPSTVIGRLSRAIKAIEDSPMSPKLSVRTSVLKSVRLLTLECEKLN